MDRIQTMSTFVAVANEGGFAAAARSLNLSPPSVTRAISELESRIGARLFHRTTRSVQLTETGERYLADCQRILVEIEAAENQAAGLHTIPSGLVTVAAPILFGRKILAPVLNQLLSDYADISVTAIFLDRVMHMHEEGIDVSLRIANLPDSSLSAIRIGSVRHVVCASTAYLEEYGRPEHPSALAEHNLIEFAGSMAPAGWNFEQGSRKMDFRPNARLRVNNGDVAIGAAKNDSGITRVLSYQIAEEVQSGALEIILEDFEPPAIPVHVIHKEAGQTSARVRAVVDYLVKRIRNHPAIS
jgi:DNA-binding transcriptional LysR family regulator